MPLPNTSTATFAPIGMTPRRYVHRVIARPAGQAVTANSGMTEAEAREAMLALSFNVLGLALGAFLGYRVVTRACRIED